MHYARSNKTSEYFTAKPSKYPQKKFKAKPCRQCGTTFDPLAPSHLYCSDTCSTAAQTEKYLKKTYGISWEEYILMHHLQNGVCKICGGKGFKMQETHQVLLVVDHCHESGKVRGLLCHNCNRGLGLFQDSIDYLLKAAEYLEGATTIPKGSTPKWVEAHGPSI